MHTTSKAGVLYLIRGVSGCGKSTLAQELSNLYTGAGKTVVWIEADKFLYTESGDYVWTTGRVIEAHRQAYLQAKQAFKDGVQVIIVSNQSIREQDMTDFLEFAKEFNYTVVRFVVENMHGDLNGKHGVQDDQAKEAARVIRSNIRLLPQRMTNDTQ